MENGDKRDREREKNSAFKFINRETKDEAWTAIATEIGPRWCTEVYWTSGLREFTTLLIYQHLHVALYAVSPPGKKALSARVDRINRPGLDWSLKEKLIWIPYGYKGFPGQLLLGKLGRELIDTSKGEEWRYIDRREIEITRIISC